MERKAFVEKYHHLIAGMILDAAMMRNRDGAEMSLWMRGIMGRVDSMLNQAHADLTTEQKPVAQPPALKVAKT